MVLAKSTDVFPQLLLLTTKSYCSQCLKLSSHMPLGCLRLHPLLHTQDGSLAKTGVHEKTPE